MENLGGTTIKGYELLERIGAGGFGAVYRAYQSTVSREVAIKMILPGIAHQPEFIRRFEMEAQLVARLEHMNIVPLYDYWRDQTGAYLVMRLLRGGSLKDRLQQKPCTIEEVGHLLSQITSALALAHNNSVIHRDLKPANILLDEDGNAYLTDFGIAKDYTNIDGSMTKGDMIIGSLDYISPEQARSEAVSPRTDVYSLGVVLYEMLTGEHPFAVSSPIERMYKHLNDPLPEVINLPKHSLTAVNEIIQKATAKNPTQRYENVIEFANAFMEAANLTQEAPGDSLVEILTVREQEVLQLMIDGLSNKEIASQLVVTINTIKYHQKQIYGKLRVHNRVQAIVRARELELIYGETGAGGEKSSFDGHTTSLMQIRLENPYKGLQAFQSNDSQDFFGREKFIQKVITRLGDHSRWSRFFAIVGPSGSGKSSFVRAGIIPALWRGDLAGSDRWYIVDMMPGTHPLEELEIALTQIATGSTDIMQQLQRDDRGLLRVVRMLLPDDGSELVIVIDQFEEVFTLLEDEAMRQYFLQLLYNAVADPRSRVRIIVTLRADFYDRPLRYPDFGEMLRSRMETVLPLSAEELERAIVSPAQRVGVRFEEGLVSAIVSEVNYQSGALPLLQYALTELFERREGHTLSREAYQALGGTVGALAKRADDIYLELDAAGQEIVRQLFLRLVTLGEGTEDTRRRVRRNELLSINADGDLVDEIIDTYAAYRMLSLDRDPATRSPSVEVAHEAILREWERLRNWLSESRNDIRLQRQIAQTADEWQSNDHDKSYLLHGSRLEQAEVWKEQTDLMLTPLEAEFIEASIQQREAQAIAETKRQKREEAQERRATNLLRASMVMAFMTGLAVISIIFAFLQNRQLQTDQDLFSLQVGYVSTLSAGGIVISLDDIGQEPQSFVATATANAEILGREPSIQEFDGVQMVLVPPGCFIMGSILETNEQPTHEICFDDPYWIDRTEVTNEQFSRFADPQVFPHAIDANYIWPGPDYPTAGTPWGRAVIVCGLRNARLPTEAEWEYAARGPESRLYPWGSKFISDNVVYIDNSGMEPSTVSSHPNGASWVGAYDMLGNVWEWTSTIYDQELFPYPYVSDDGREAYNEFLDHVVRGGSYRTSTDFTRTTIRQHRGEGSQVSGAGDIGFRCVRDYEQ